MKETFLIGNGYDRAIGLNTGYSDFLDEYVKSKSRNENPHYKELIDRMKEDINSNRTLWADLEITLGKYTEEFDNWEDYAAVYEDINKELRQYIEKEQNRLGKDIKFSRESALNGFVNPMRLLEPADQSLMYSFFNSYGSITEINVISLNYTNTIESELEAQVANKVIVNQILHLHGMVDDTIILGVSDEKQIANPSFREKKYLKDFLIKSEANKTIKSNIDIRCQNLIASSDIIVTFGVSLGESDDYIWRMIGKQLSRNNFKLIIFQYSPDVDFTHTRWKLGAAEDKVKDQFLTKDHINGLATPQMRDNIIVAFNKPLFGDYGNTDTEDKNR